MENALATIENKNVLTVCQIQEDMESSYRLAKALSIMTTGADNEKVATQALGKMVIGAELGIGPGASVRGIYVIKGNISLSADLMMALVKAQGWKAEIKESKPLGEWCEVVLTKKGDTAVTGRYTIEMSKTSGLYAQNQNYKRHPWAMLYARAASIACRRAAPDRLHGIYTQEEAEALPDAYKAQDTPKTADKDPLLKDAKEPETKPAEEPIDVESEPVAEEPPTENPVDTTDILKTIGEEITRAWPKPWTDSDFEKVQTLLMDAFGTPTWKEIQEFTFEKLEEGVTVVSERAAAAINSEDEALLDEGRIHYIVGVEKEYGVGFKTREKLLEAQFGTKALKDLTRKQGDEYTEYIFSNYNKG